MTISYLTLRSIFCFFQFKKYYIVIIAGILLGAMTGIFCAMSYGKNVISTEDDITIELAKSFIESEKRYDDALRILLPIAKRGNWKALEFCICIYSSRNEMAKIEKLKRYVKKNNIPDYDFLIGFLLENGLGVKKDHKQAIVNYKFAADAGLAWAQYKYAKLLFDERDKDEEAMVYLWKSAKSGNSMALYLLAEMLNSGAKTLKKDTSLALKLMRIAADKNNILAKCAYNEMKNTGDNEKMLSTLFLFFELADYGARDLQVEIRDFYKDMNYTQKVNEWNSKIIKNGLSGEQIENKILLQDINLECFFDDLNLKNNEDK